MNKYPDLNVRVLTFEIFKYIPAFNIGDSNHSFGELPHQFSSTHHHYHVPQQNNSKSGMKHKIKTKGNIHEKKHITKRTLS